MEITISGITVSNFDSYKNALIRGIALVLDVSEDTITLVLLFSSSRRRLNEAIIEAQIGSQSESHADALVASLSNAGSELIQGIQDECAAQGLTVSVTNLGIPSVGSSTLSPSSSPTGSPSTTSTATASVDTTLTPGAFPTARHPSQSPTVEKTSQTSMGSKSDSANTITSPLLAGTAAVLLLLFGLFCSCARFSRRKKVLSDLENPTQMHESRVNTPGSINAGTPFGENRKAVRISYADLHGILVSEEDEEGTGNKHRTLYE